MRPPGIGQRVDREQRQQWVARYEQSGLSVRAFTQQEGLNYWTFRNWLQQRSSTRTLRATEPQTPGVTFRQVRNPLRGGTQPPVEVQLPNGTQLRLDPSVPAAWIAELVRALNSTPSC